MPLLTIDQITLAFGHLPLFNGANLRIEPGERLALIGRNGSGKSTLLKVVAGDIEPDTGTIWRAPALRIARLAQDIPAGDERTVREEVGAGLAPDVEGWSADHRIDAILSRLSLPADRRVAELSGGWRRRVLLGKA